MSKKFSNFGVGMFVLEALGAIFAILGAYLMSLSTKHHQRPLYLAFIAFFMSNLCLFAFFLFEGKVPILIQILFFYVGAFLGILRKSSQRQRDVKRFTVISFVYVLCLIVLVWFYPLKLNNFEIVPIDSLAAGMAILGNFLLSSSNHIRRSYAFILFFLADILYVYVGYTNGFYFFMIQSFFFLYTSVNGYKNTMKEEIALWLSSIKK
jgi:hypothetical protein